MKSKDFVKEQWLSKCTSIEKNACGQCNNLFDTVFPNGLDESPEDATYYLICRPCMNISLDKRMAEAMKELE